MIYTSPSIVMIMKSRRPHWVGHDYNGEDKEYILEKHPV
jgi:hypothetical protein